ncbi:hypothetical protein SAMN04487941_2704 [Pontibacter akesuensis]|uniref:Uncharacterized protein n=1 Tax=Pontibacter akesuensis TaxID=388950 RepID=A0A1I7JC71_9BACT|nr:hypothetical protein SAMN04487941_2704 [Pontibacter akesuensis]
MTMPEASMYKNYCAVLWEHDIRFANKLLVMDSVPEASFEEFFSQQNFWLSVLAFDSGHIIAPNFFGMNISHNFK